MTNTTAMEADTFEFWSEAERSEAWKAYAEYQLRQAITDALEKIGEEKTRQIIEEEAA